MNAQYPATGPPPGPPLQGMPPPQVVVVTTQPGVVPLVVGQPMGTVPTPYNCPSCRAQIMTKVVMKSTMKTHIFAALLCVLGCWSCVFVPYCVDSCKNANHFCPYCDSYIGCNEH